MTQLSELEDKRSDYVGLKLSLKSDIKRFSWYRRATQDFLLNHLPPSSLIDDLIVVIDEALTNIATHAYDGRTDCDIRMRLEVESWNAGGSKLLTLTFKDSGENGANFQPSAQLAENLSCIAAGERTGYGLLLLYRLMDVVEYQPGERGMNRLTMRKFISQEVPQAAYVPRLIDEMQRIGGPLRQAQTGQPSLRTAGE